MPTLIQTLLGTWFICSTNFPMWLKGDKTNPTFTYSAVPGKGDTPVLLDEVRYLKKGKSRTLVGYDHQDVQDPSVFVWRGKGLMSLLRSKWQVMLQDPEGQWAVIWFSKTLFTPEGADIISRTPQLSPQQLARIKTLMANDPRLASQLATMRELPIR